MGNSQLSSWVERKGRLLKDNFNVSIQVEDINIARVNSDNRQGYERKDEGIEEPTVQVQPIMGSRPDLHMAKMRLRTRVE
jgi:hypothetical protein